VKRFWNFIANPHNLAALTAIGGLLAFLYSHFFASRPPPPANAPAQVAAPAPAGTATSTTGNNGIVIQNSTAGRDIRAGATQ
jgi:hypothetical protein